MALNVPFLQLNCQFVLENCNFLGSLKSTCVSEYCHGFPSTSGTCPEIGLDPDNCCGSSDPATCLNTFAHGSGAGSDSSGNPCASVVGELLACSSATPAIFPSGSFATAGPLATSLAGCICYDANGTYDPAKLDGFASECVASGSAAHPTYFSYGSLMNGFCTNVAKPAATTASTTSAVAKTTSATATPSVTSSVPSTTSNSGTTASKTSSSAVSTTPTSSGVLTTFATTSSTAGSTTTSKSPGNKNSLQTYAILLLGASMLLSISS